MSGWTHTLCDDCWDLLERGRDVVRIKSPPIELCCRCGAVTTAGIYYRQEPKTFDYCDHDQRFAKSLGARLTLAEAHIENLIQRIYELENGLDQEEL
jgi:hypothetical protein